MSSEQVYAGLVAKVDDSVRSAIADIRDGLDDLDAISGCPYFRYAAHAMELLAVSYLGRMVGAVPTTYLSGAAPSRRCRASRELRDKHAQLLAQIAAGGVAMEFAGLFIAVCDRTGQRAPPDTPPHASAQKMMFLGRAVLELIRASTGAAIKLSNAMAEGLKSSSGGGVPPTK